MANQGNANKGPGQQGGQGRPVGEQVRQAAGAVGEKAREVAGNVGQRAREAASTATDAARHAAGEAREKAEAGTHALGSGMRNVASQLRQNAPHEGMVGNAASGLADTLERGGHYLEQEGMEGLVNDISTVIRRNPLPAVLASVGLGFLMARMFRSER